MDCGEATVSLERSLMRVFDPIPRCGTGRVQSRYTGWLHDAAMVGGSVRLLAGPFWRPSPCFDSRHFSRCAHTNSHVLQPLLPLEPQGSVNLSREGPKQAGAPVYVSPKASKVEVQGRFGPSLVGGARRIRARLLSMSRAIHDLRSTAEQHRQIPVRAFFFSCNRAHRLPDPPGPWTW